MYWNLTRCINTLVLLPNAHKFSRAIHCSEVWVSHLLHIVEWVWELFLYFMARSLCMRTRDLGGFLHEALHSFRSHESLWSIALELWLNIKVSQVFCFSFQWVHFISPQSLLSVVAILRSRSSSCLLFNSRQIVKGFFHPTLFQPCPFCENNLNFCSLRVLLASG